MAFGLCGAPNTFQGAMNATLRPLLRKCALVFFDDILVYSSTLEDHVYHLKQVLSLLHQDKWQVKLSKCSFAQRQVDYLGHVISEQGVATDPAKITAIAEWSSPTNVKQLRSFLGLARYYRKFVRHFSIILKPLIELLKKQVYFLWIEQHEQAFVALKSTLIEAPVLALPDFPKNSTLETDASELGVGAVLMQQGHSIAFISKAVGPRSKGLSTYEKEYLTILIAVDQWRSYLQLAVVTIVTNQQSLVHLSDQRLHAFWQQNVFSKLIGMQYKIIYRVLKIELLMHYQGTPPP
jgi:hypothetical protein